MRHLSTIGLLILVLFAPYWFYLPALFVAVIAFPFYLEAVGLALLADVLYGTGQTSLFWNPLSLATAVAVVLAVPLRSYLRFNVA